MFLVFFVNKHITTGEGGMISTDKKYFRDKFFPIQKVLSCWRFTENSLSSNKFQKLSDSFKLFYKIENKNFINSIFSVIVLSYNKILKI